LSIKGIKKKSLVSEAYMSPQNSSTEWGDMLDEMQRDKEASAGTRKYWQPPSDKEGTFPIRILPPLRSKGEKKFYFKHQIHWVDRIPYECLGQDLVDKNGVAHKAEDCPICSFVKKLYRTSEKNTDGWKLAGELRAKDRYDPPQSNRPMKLNQYFSKLVVPSSKCFSIS
jgi:hypothetical protein